MKSFYLPTKEKFCKTPWFNFASKNTTLIDIYKVIDKNCEDINRSMKSNLNHNVVNNNVSVWTEIKMAIATW